MALLSGPGMADLLDHLTCFAQPHWLTDVSAWHEHMPFAFHLVDVLRPNLFVELGTHKGDSYCAFCQAVSELQLSTRCYALDTWAGDEHAGVYGAEVLEQLRAHHDPLYGTFSTLLQCTFDEGLPLFADGSIDLLHIDGLHSYDAARHDFDSWLPKLSRAAVVLLHDISVEERGFGVCRLWNELKAAYPSFEFTHGNGLGILGIGNDLPAGASRLFGLSEPRRRWYASFFSVLGKGVTTERLLETTKTALREEAEEVAQLKRAASAAVTAAANDDPSYQEWVLRHAFTDADRGLIQDRLSALAEQPRIHLLCEVRPKERDALTGTISDLRSQIYAPWLLTVVAPFARPAEYGDIPSLEWIETRESPNDAAASAVLRSRADWVAAIKPGDRLEPHWLAVVTLYSNERPEWQLIYCDEDRIDESGTRFAPIFKPDFNLDLLRSMPYQGDCIFVRRVALDALPEVRLLGPAAAYNLSLSVLDQCGEAALGHIPEILYHRSVRMEHRVSVEAEERAGMRALRAHLRRSGVDAAVQQGFLPRTYRVTCNLPGKPAVSIVIPTRDRLDLLAPCVESLLQKTEYSNYEVIIVDNNSEVAETLAYLESLPQASLGRVRVLHYPHAFNYSAINNFAAREARGEFLLLLNNDTQIIQGQWLERMLMHGMRPEVGVVGARLIFPDGRLQHAGVIVGLSGVADHPHLGLPMQAPGYMGRAQVDQDLSAVTAACLLIRKSLFLEVRGFDEERFPVLFNDVDLCLKVRKRGLKVVWTPYATVVHHGSVSQNSEKAGEKKIGRILREQSAMVERWIGTMAEDPAYNRNLSLADNRFRVEDRIDIPWDANFRDRLRIMGYAADHAGCGQYRVYGPLRALQRAGRAQCFALEAQTGRGLPSAWEIARAAPDTLLLQSALHGQELQQLEALQWAGNIFRIFELDDLKTSVPRTSVHARTIPKDVGHRLERALSMCDRLIVATQPLKEAYRKLIGDIVVVPNYLESERWEGLRSAQRQGPRPRVGWAGSISHSGDLALLQQVMRELASEADFVLFGMCPPELRPYVREFHPAVPFDAYPARLASLGLDLAIAPLELNEFNAAKSNLRILEYGILGWPVVCTDIEPYRNAPVRRVRNRPEEWIEAIRENLHDLRAAKEAGASLRTWVLDHWMLDDHLDEWMAALGRKSAGRSQNLEAGILSHGS